MFCRFIECEKFRQSLMLTSRRHSLATTEAGDCISVGLLGESVAASSGSPFKLAL